MDQQKPPKHKIDNVTAVLMVSVAVLFDLLIFLINFIPVLGQIISVFIAFFAYLIFLFWFMMKGVKLMTGKKIASMGGGFLVSIIPIVNMLPAIIFSVLMTILIDRKDLKLTAGITGKVAGASMLK